MKRRQLAALAGAVLLTFGLAGTAFADSRNPSMVNASVHGRAGTVTISVEIPRVASMTIAKTADPTHLPATGGDVTYSYVVTNTGTVDIFHIVVTDDNGTPSDTGDDFTASCPQTTLVPDAHMTCTADVSGITQTTTNVATLTADWDKCNDDCSDAIDPVTDTATVTVAAATKSIDLDKTVAPLNLPAGGGDVTYTYVVTNTGDVELTNISIKDDNGTPSNTDDDFTVTCPHTTLAAGAHMTCTADVAGTTKTTINVATVTATAGEDIVTDHDSAKVTVLSGGVQGQTNLPTPPPTDTIAPTTTDAGGSLPLLLIVLGVIGLGAVTLTSGRVKR